MQKKIIFRADGSSEVGLGHMFRMFALVEMYREKFDFVFVTKENSTLDVIPTNYKTLLVPQEIDYQEEPVWLAKNFSSKEYIVIADGYEFTSSYQKKIKEQGFFLMYIDDLTLELMYADIVVNHAIHVQPKDYKAQSYTKFALGSDYAMLRPKFLQAAQQRRKIKKIDSAFVCFGGGDIFDYSFKVTQALLQTNYFQKIHIVLGGAYSHKNIFVLAEQNQKTFLYQNLDETELYNLMRECDYAIVPASTILYEVCCVKMPVISGYYVDNQKEIYHAMVKNGLVCGMGNIENFTANEFQDFFVKNIFAIDAKVMMQKQKKFLDGKSKDRFLELLG